MPSELLSGENAPFVIVCAIFAVLAIFFFATIFFADSGTNRKKSGKKNHHKHAVRHSSGRK
jgi:hypothetical protein